jgi:hypothetical protein
MAEIAALGHVFSDLQREPVERRILLQRRKPPPGTSGVDVVEKLTLLGLNHGRRVRP